MNEKAVQTIIEGIISQDEVIEREIRKILNKTYELRGQYEKELERMLGCTVYVSVAIHPQEHQRKQIRKALTGTDWRGGTTKNSTSYWFSKGEACQDVGVHVNKEENDGADKPDEDPNPSF